MTTQAPPAVLDPAMWMDRALATLALRLRHEVALTRALRGSDRQEGFLGLFLSDDEAEVILAEASSRLRVSGTAASAAQVAASEDALARARMADPGGIWCRLADRFDLAEAELDLLVLTAAPALDPRIGRVYGYLNDDLARRHLTPALALRLLDRHRLDQATLRRMLAPDGPLVAASLVLMGPERPLVEAPLRMAEEVVDHLLGLEGLPPLLSPLCEHLPVPRRPATVAPDVWLFGDVTQRGGDDAVALAAGLGLDLLLIDGDRMAGHDRPRPALVAACVREARLLGVLPVLDGFDACPDAERQEIGARLLPPAVVLTAQPAAWEGAGLAASPPPSSATERAARIAGLLAGHPADGPELRDWLCRRMQVDVLTLATLLRRHGDEEGVRAAVRARTSRGLRRLTDPVETAFSLSDLVLPQRARAALEQLVAWQDTSSTVLGDWGLGKVFAKRPGTIALFKGPSGTGKTMAASAVANALDLPLHRVNLAGLVSKYIGETEKNLDRLFAAAEAADVVLFFDEADAIFGRRSEVQDAHDRYANLETSYLLQRLETYSGIAILASNLHQNIDEAFVRRLDLVVELPPPRPGARRAIWQRIAATDAPLDPAVDLDLLAERFELTGGEIRNCWLAAAHAAARQGRSIEEGHLMQAVGRELIKAGKPIRRASFGAHYAGLRPEDEPR